MNKTYRVRPGKEREPESVTVEYRKSGSEPFHDRQYFKNAHQALDYISTNNDVSNISVILKPYDFNDSKEQAFLEVCLSYLEDGSWPTSTIAGGYSGKKVQEKIKNKKSGDNYE